MGGAAGSLHAPSFAALRPCSCGHRLVEPKHWVVNLPANLVPPISSAGTPRRCSTTARL